MRYLWPGATFWWKFMQNVWQLETCCAGASDTLEGFMYLLLMGERGSHRREDANLMKHVDYWMQQFIITSPEDRAYVNEKLQRLTNSHKTNLLIHAEDNILPGPERDFLISRGNSENRVNPPASLLPDSFKQLIWILATITFTHICRMGLDCFE